MSVVNPVSLFAELKRRRVIRALVGYGIAGFAVLQIIEPVMHGLHWPEEVLSYVVVVLAVGFPVVVSLAWIFDVNAGRIERTTATPAVLPNRALLAALLVALGLAAAAPGLFYFFVWRRPPRLKTDRSVAVVAVLPFTVRGSQQFSYLGEGMVDLLSTNLSGGFVRTVDPHALLSYLGREERVDPERARAVAAHFGAGMYVLGTVLEADKRLRLIASLYETSAGSTPALEAKAEGEAMRLFEMVDDLTSQLRARVGGASAEQLRGPEARFARLAQVTTSSVAALKEYLDGERWMRKSDVKEARDAFRRAVDADPEFALAWYRLAIAGSWAEEDSTAAREASRNAVARSGRLSEQDRDRMVAASAFLQGKVVEAERLYRQILVTHPDDVDAWYMLGETLIHYGHYQGRPPGDAREPFEKTLVLDPQHDGALIHLWDIAEFEGRLVEFVALADRYLALYSGSRVGSWLPWARALAADDKQTLARETAAIHKAPSPVLWNAFWQAMRTRHFREAEEVARFALEPGRPEKDQRNGHDMLWRLDLARGRLRAALVEAQQSADPDEQLTKLYPAVVLRNAYMHPADQASLQAHLQLVRALPATGEPIFLAFRQWAIGSLAARLGDAGSVERAASEAENVPFEGETVPQDIAWALRGEMAFRQGRPDDALTALQHMRNEVTYDYAWVFYPVQRDIRGQILERQGRDAEAARWYSVRAYNESETIFMAPLAFRLARLEEKRGNFKNAIAHYGQVVELWRDCDAELRPLVAEVKQRLAALRPTSAAK